VAERYVAEGEARIDIALAQASMTLDPVIVSASRQAETSLDAPTSVSVIDRQRIRKTMALTPVDHVRTETGVDFASKGLIQHSYAVRGSRSVTSGALLTLTDYRYTALPSLGLNVSYLVPLQDDDIERIELVRGPAAALYGPNSSRGVLHVVTRSPFDAPGTSLSIAGGERSLFQGVLRHAGVIGEKLGYKISGSYFSGRDWEYTDPVEAENREDALAGGADPDELLIGLRDFDIRRAAGDARVDWRPRAGTEISLRGGMSSAINNIDQTVVGASQVRDWRYFYLQTSVTAGRFFANLIHNNSDAGNTYQLRSGQPIVDSSLVWAVQLQHGALVGNRWSLVYGADAKYTIPRTGGTVHGANEANDDVLEVGAYLNTTTALARAWDAIAALRVDYHDRLNDVALSPRIGVVYKPAPVHAVRLTYNRAYNSPDPQDLFIDFRVDSFLFYEARLRGTGETGLSFSRNCGGLCMRSPFNILGPSELLPTDATLLWPAVVLFARQMGIDLSMLPAPTANDVSTDLKRLDANAEGVKFDPITAADVQDIAPLEREFRNVFELGYKGFLGERVNLSADVYVDRVVNQQADALFVATPNAFFNQASLERYLEQYMLPESARALADTLSKLPVGTVAPAETDDADIVAINLQGGSYTVWGFDVALSADISRAVTVRASYSYASHDSIPDVGAGGAVIPNVPKHKGSVGGAFTEPRIGVTVRADLRAVAGFPVVSGVYRGRVDSYAAVDAGIAFQFPWQPTTRISIEGQNLFGAKHREFVGAPELGRLILTRLHVSF
jgi:iron complex outermembrane receptor protein